MITTRSPSEALAWINRHQVGSAAADRGTRELAEGLFRIGCRSVDCDLLSQEWMDAELAYARARNEYETPGNSVERSRELAAQMRALERKVAELKNKYERCCT
jgi:hypothetical protein